MKPTYTSVQRVGLYLFSSSDLSRRRSPSPVRPCSPGAPYPRKAVGKTKLRASQLHSPSPYACPCPLRDHGPSANRSAPRRPCKPPGSSICFSIFETGRVPPQPCQISPRRPWATPTWRSVITCPRTRPGTPGSRHDGQKRNEEEDIFNSNWSSHQMAAVSRFALAPDELAFLASRRVTSAPRRAVWQICSPPKDIHTMTMPASQKTGERQRCAIGPGLGSPVDRCSPRSPPPPPRVVLTPRVCMACACTLSGHSDRCLPSLGDRWRLSVYRRAQERCRYPGS